MKNILLQLLVVAALTVAVTAYADLIVYEPFDYTLGLTNPDPDGGVNGGNGLPYTNVGGDPAGTSTGLRNSWSTDTVVTNGLSYGQLIVSNNALLLKGGKQYNPSQVYLYRNMITDPYQSLRGESSNGFGKDGETIWGSMLFRMDRVSSSDRFGFYFRGFDEGTYNRITLLSLFGANFTLNLQDGSANNAPGSSTTVNRSVAPNTDVNLLLWKHEFGNGTETFSLWFNPDLSSPGTADYVLTTGREVGFGGFGWDTRTGLGTTIDEIRVGTTMADVLPLIPEPSTGLLIAAGIGLLLAVRRRR